MKAQGKEFKAHYRVEKAVYGVFSCILQCQAQRYLPLWKGPLFHQVLHAAETDVVGAGINLTLTPCADHIAGAILVGTKK